MTSDLWFLIFLGFWTAIIIAVGLLLVRRIRREAKAVRNHERPEYDFGSSISDWEQACQKSYDWSHARRNGTLKKEAKR